jgi:hypothetical protein
MASTDTEFLKERLAKKKAHDAIGDTSQPLSVDAGKALEDLTESTPDLKEQIRQRKLHRQAEKLDAEDASIEQRKIDKLQEEAAIQEKQDSKRLTDIVSRNTDKAGELTGKAADRIGSMKTTGGISLLLVILALLMFIVVRVNAAGDTRLKQLWYMLNGRTSLQGKVTLTGATGGVQGSSGDFGSGPIPATNGASSTISPLGYRGNTSF